MDLSKTCDCLPHDLLIAKLEVYGLDKPNLSLVNDYLCFRKQRTRNGSSYSNWANVTRSIPRKIYCRACTFEYLLMIFYYLLKKLTCNFDDHNTLFSGGDNLSVILKSLERDMKILLRCFNSSSLKVNPG